jgi:hypothetical protein
VNAVRRDYEHALRGAARIAESAPSGDSELSWQARWFSGACGREFTTSDGRKVVITDFGQWNREAGPDFVRAAIKVDGHEQCGAIEVDLEASGWEQHRHAVNPAYEDVVLHVIVRRPARKHFTRTPANREVPQVLLADHAATEAEWPAFAAARPGRCLAPLRDLSADRITDLLAVAARRRLEGKGAALRTMITSRGADAALFEAVSVALGYKNNKLPFQLLAQRVPLTTASTARGEALLFGLAGFLEKSEPPAGAARAELAVLWSKWWKLRAAFSHAILPRDAWKLTGLRPANHPLRRLGALAAIAKRWKSIRAALESGELARLEKVLAPLQHPFWSLHTTWLSPRRKSPLALIGSDRIREIHANIALPLALARGEDRDWLDLPCGPPNTSLRIVSARLFGGPLPRTLPKRLFVHQGLLQIYADFCLRDHGECAQCRFPALVGTLTA